MAYSWRPVIGLSTNAGTFTNYAPPITGDGVEMVQILAAATATTVVNFPLAVANVKAFGLKSNKAVDLGVNDIFSGSPDGSASLNGIKPVIWVYGDTDNYPAANPLGTTNFVTLHVTNAGADDATVDFVVLYDSTP